MKKRVLSSIYILLIIGVFFALRFLEISAFDFLILAINLIGAYEVSICYTQNKRHNFLYAILFFVLSNYLGLTICFAYDLKIIFPILILLANLCLSIIFMFLLGKIQKEQVIQDFNSLKDETLDFKIYLKQRYVTTIKVLIYPCLILSTLYFINNISRLSFDVLKNNVDLGWYILLSVFTVSMSTDTFAFFVGKLLKGPKLAPKISPKKTISGAIGGLVFGIISSVALFLIFNIFEAYNVLFNKINLNVWHIAMIAMEASIANQIGDLVESAIKRKIGVKDFGNLFPGHGGIMDRVDGLSFVSVVILVIYVIALI